MGKQRGERGCGGKRVRATNLVRGYCVRPPNDGVQRGRRRVVGGKWAGRPVQDVTSGPGARGNASRADRGGRCARISHLSYSSRPPVKVGRAGTRRTGFCGGRRLCLKCEDAPEAPPVLELRLRVLFTMGEGGRGGCRVTHCLWPAQERYRQVQRPVRNGVRALEEHGLAVSDSTHSYD